MMIRTIYDGKQKVQKKDEKNHNEFLAACENFLWQKKKFLQAAANSIYHHYKYKHAFRQ